MTYDNWFIGVQAPPYLGGGALPPVREGHPPAGSECEARTFELGGGLRFSLRCACGPATIENSKYWTHVLSPRPPETGLLRALAGSRSLADIERAGIAADSTVVAVDKEAGRVHAVSDRLNMSRLFHGRTGNEHILASKVSAFPSDRLTLDPAAVASLAVNGHCLANRTLYREVSVLERASRHEISRDRVRSASYWDYRPGRAVDAGMAVEDAMDGLWRRLAEAVDRATRGRRVLLALSGGYDSGVLLGLLGKELKHPDVTCFSYVYGSPKPDSDAAVAARQAALYGYRHLTIASYAGDFLGMIARNAAVGEGLRGPAYEIDAYRALAAEFGDASSAVLLFGDECFGWGSYRLQDRNDCLGAINLKAPAALDAIAGPKAAEGLRHGLETDYAALRERIAGFVDLDAAKDFLYLDQRIQFSLLPLRSTVAGGRFPIALPFLSPAVLDFMAGVPTPLRLDKRLFKAAARRHLPELFRVPRATRAQLHPDFDREILAAAPALRRTLVEQGWSVGKLLPTETLLGILAAVEATAAAPRRIDAAGAIKQRLKRSLKAIFARSRLLEDRQRHLRRLGYNEFDRPPGRETLLMNLLCAAGFLVGHAAEQTEAPDRLSARAG